MACSERLIMQTGTLFDPSYQQKRYRIATWSEFQRVDYLRRRFIDLHQRFSRTVNVFSNDFHDMPVLELLNKVSLSLENPPKLVVYKDVHLIEEYKALKDDDEVKKSGSLEVHVLCITLIHLRTEDDIARISQQHSERYKSIWDICITSLEMVKPFSQNTIDRKRTIHLLNKDIPLLIDPSDDTLTAHLEMIVEAHIVRGFELMYFYLEQFLTSITTTMDTSMDTTYSKVIRDAIKNTIFDNDLSTTSDPSRSNVLDNVCQKVHCYLVPIYCLQNNIPVRVCHTLLWRFTTSMRESASPKVKEELFKFKQSIEKEKIEPRKRTPRETKDLVEKLTSELFDEFRGELQKVERNLKTAIHVTTVMKKMTFEIKGHLRQALIKSDIVPTDNSYPKISESLRLNISKTEGVYAVGAVFGELQIHLKPDVVDVADVKKRIARLLIDNRNGYPYKVQVMDRYPILFFRQGDKCTGAYGYGTIGCFVKDKKKEFASRYLCSCCKSHGRTE